MKFLVLPVSWRIRILGATWRWVDILLKDVSRCLYIQAFINDWNREAASNLPDGWALILQTQEYGICHSPKDEAKATWSQISGQLTLENLLPYVSHNNNGRWTQSGMIRFLGEFWINDFCMKWECCDYGQSYQFSFGEKEGLGGKLGVERSHGVCINKR